MWIKLWSACLLVALVNAEYLYDENPYSHYGGYASAYDNYKPTNYKFEYGVSDPHTGDHKSQWEVKENGVVRGAYSLLEPDGTTRVVEYYADDTGFHADVKKIGTAIHEAPQYGKLHSLADAHITDSLAYNGYGHGGVTHSYGAPIAAVAKVAAPIPAPIYSAPIAQVQHIAPVPQVIAPQIHHLGTPSAYDFGHHAHFSPQFYNTPDAHYAHDIYATAGPVYHQPAPFKVPTSSFKVETPHLVHAAPVIKEYAAPVIAKTYVEPQIVAKTYAEPQIVAPIDYGYSHGHQHQHYQPEIVAKSFAVPAPEYKTYAAPAVINSGYAAVPDPYYAHPLATAKVAVSAKVVQNPIMRFFAPLAKYFAAPIVPKAVPAKVVSTPTYYAEAPAAKYIGDYNAYNAGYKPEVVVHEPHNYGYEHAY